MTRHPDLPQEMRRLRRGAAGTFLRRLKDLPRLHPRPRATGSASQQSQNHSVAPLAFPAFRTGNARISPPSAAGTLS